LSDRENRVMGSKRAHRGQNRMWGPRGDGRVQNCKPEKRGLVSGVFSDVFMKSSTVKTARGKKNMDRDRKKREIRVTNYQKVKFTAKGSNSSTREGGGAEKKKANGIDRGVVGDAKK